MIQKYPKLFGGITAFVGLVFYVSWSGFDVPLPDMSSLRIEIESLNESNNESIDLTANGLTIVAFAPAFQPSDYASPMHLKAKLTPYFDAAQAAGLFDGPTVVLLPAHTMTPLLFTGYGSRVYNAGSLGLAAMPIIAQNAIEFGKNYFIFESDRPMAAAFIRTQSKVAAAAIRTVFGGLAKKYGVHIAPGSGVLMTPGVYPDALTYGHGPIFHTSFMFGPDGKAMEDAVRQVTPTAPLRGIIKQSLAEFLPIFEVAGKRLMIAIDGDMSPPELNQSIDFLLSSHFGDVRTMGSGLPAMAISSNARGWGLSEDAAKISLIDSRDTQQIQSAAPGTIYTIKIGAS